MRRLLFVLCLSLLSGVVVAAEPGPTARALSFVTIGGVKLAARAAPADNARVDPACVLAIDDHAIAGVFAELLDRQLSDEQRAAADAFYASANGDKLNRFTVQFLAIENGFALTEEPIQITAAEKADMEAFAQTDAGLALARLTARTNLDTVAALGPALRPLLDACPP